MRNSVLWFVSLSLLTFSESKNCIRQDSCTCSFDDYSGTVSLYNVGRRDGIPLLNEAEIYPDGAYYSYNPCYPFTKLSGSEGCRDVAACVYNQSMGIYCNIGDPGSVRFSYDGVNVIATYIALDCGIGWVTTVVTLICDASFVIPEARAFGAIAENVYGFSVRSTNLCPLEGTTPGPFTGTTEETTPPVETTVVGWTTAPMTPMTTAPMTTPLSISTSPRPGIFCDYQSLLGNKLRMCLEVNTGNVVTPFVPPYMNTYENVVAFCFNLPQINKCVQDSVGSCDFDSRVTTLFGNAGLGLQAAYESLCAHQFAERDEAFLCLTRLDVNNYKEPLNEFIKDVDELSDPNNVCSFAIKLMNTTLDEISTNCHLGTFAPWTLFWDNFMAGCPKSFY